MIFKKNKLLRNFIYIKLKLLFIKKNNWKKFTLFFKFLFWEFIVKILKTHR